MAVVAAVAAATAASTLRSGSWRPTRRVGVGMGGREGVLLTGPTGQLVRELRGGNDGCAVATTPATLFCEARGIAAHSLWVCRGGAPAGCRAVPCRAQRVGRHPAGVGRCGSSGGTPSFDAGPRWYRRPGVRAGFSLVGRVVRGGCGSPTSRGDCVGELLARAGARPSSGGTGELKTDASGVGALSRSSRLVLTSRPGIAVVGSPHHSLQLSLPSLAFGRAVCGCCRLVCSLGPCREVAPVVFRRSPASPSVTPWCVRCIHVGGRRDHGRR